MIVHSTNDGSENRDAVCDFWSARFPLAFITNIPFLTENPGWGNTGLSERALELLSEVEKDRSSRVSRISLFSCSFVNLKTTRPALEPIGSSHMYSFAMDSGDCL